MSSLSGKDQQLFSFPGRHISSPFASFPLSLFSFATSLCIPWVGGLRHTTKDSINTGWENLSFRGYADYMATDAFQEGLQELKSLAEQQRVAIMCAEAVPWRCHRSLVADALIVQNWEVLDIQSKKTAKLHVLTPFLKVENGKIIYPAPS